MRGRQFPVFRPARRRAENAIGFHRRAFAKRHVLVQDEWLHDAIPSRHFFGLKRICTSLLVSTDSYNAVMSSSERRPARPSTSAAFLV